jgi:integrase
VKSPFLPLLSFKREANGRLTVESRQQLADIGLRFHDLRREAGSRFLELGTAPHYVQAFRDHAKLSTTSRYLPSTPAVCTRRCRTPRKRDGGWPVKGSVAIP